MIKTLYFFTILLWGSVLASADLEYEKLGSLAAGFTHHHFNRHTDPLTEPLRNLGYEGGIAFPDQSYSVGVEFQKIENIDKLIINLEKINPRGTEKSNLEKSLELYISDDNVNYTLVKTPYKAGFRYFTENGKPRETIELEGLNTRAKYIKIRSVMQSEYSFGTRKLPEMMTFYSKKPEAEITAFDVPRFSDKNISISIKIKNLQTKPLTLLLKTKAASAKDFNTVFSKELSASDIGTAFVNNLDLQKYPVGKIDIRAELLDEKNKIISESVKSSYHGEMAFTFPAEDTNLKGKWEKTVTESGQYWTAQNNDGRWESEITGNGWYAVYLGLVGEDSEASVNAAGCSGQKIELV